MSIQTKTSVSGYPLITRERTEKLELLNHLIANLAHAIVVCGPEGIGKTLLIKSFQEAVIESWIFCWVQADSQLSLQRIQEILGEKITQNMPDIKIQSLENVFDRMTSWNMKLVLLVDDAGLLAPGLIEKIITYADARPILRVVFALTHSELYLKNGTDPAIEDCYLIEIPPLSEKQCSEYLEYLSTLPRPRIQFSAINESMVTALYRETHGIPGNILAQLPKDDIRNKIDYSKAILIGAVIGLIAIALGAQWWSSRPKTITPKPTVAESNQSNAAIEPAKDATNSLVQSPENPVSQQTQKAAQTLNTSVSARIRNDVINDSHSQVMIEQELKRDNTGSQSPSATQLIENTSQPKSNGAPQLTETNTVIKQIQVDSTVALDAGGHWLMEQPAENITLQLMALSNEQAIIEVLQRHQALGQNLKYLKTKTRRGRDRFVLLYGSFASPEQANVESKNLPTELQKTWPRKISAIQGEINTVIPTDTPE